MPDTKTKLEALAEATLQRGIAAQAADGSAPDIKTLLAAILQAFMDFLDTCDFATWGRLRKSERPIVRIVGKRKLHKSLAAAGIGEPDCCTLAEAADAVVRETADADLDQAFQEATGDWSVY